MAPVTLVGVMSAPLPTLYKARNLPLKRPVCAICVERTKGRTEEVRLGHRVSVWLCPGHASRAFQTRRGGRDFVRTLMGVCQANGCLTQARHRALDAHLNQLRAHPPRSRPGSYAWPELRRRLEAYYAAGAPPLDPTNHHARHACPACTAHTPSRRTLQRWHAERRWLTHPP
jgi:hypothetical protein